MTDFLEELLNGQVEEEEEQELLRLSPNLTKTVRPRSDRPEERFSDAEWEKAPEVTDPRRQRATVKQRAPEVSSQQLQADDWKDTASGTANSPVQFVWEMIRRTYSAARLWQVRAVRQSGSISEPGGIGKGQAYGLHKQENIVPGYAAQVDVAFARDARRYDGPLRIL